jgi:peptidoglycan/xylan/chitin deacetylase (PgdA/CDA1 family)
MAATCNRCAVPSEVNKEVPTEKTTNNKRGNIEETTEKEQEKEIMRTKEPGETKEDIIGIDSQKEVATDMSTVIREGISTQNNKQIALTFDAGWLYENTEPLLALLDEYNIKTTFFVRGLWVKDHPNLAKEIVNRGHDLQNHSLTHGHMKEMTDAEVRNEIVETTKIIRDITGFLPHLFRPPYGEYDERILRILAEEGYPYTIMWTVDSHDWAEEINGVKVTKDYLVERVLDNATDYGIVLMHVGGYETVSALPEIIYGLKSEGYELVKVKDML